ncbi:hypothetical protein QY96_01564 [Bacillus thermotolerans]|uniref:Uncharacterized protein n=1 Tax=Bacillus thermotolerans TaxID=1221996 RepID=A0A0F5HMT7_BACTR|nr:hypothetical protein QY95_04028 [Bacillus thermotolerans]KKB42090.1 hypothetical protein QY96_01564 [Bacillus thermotolerans]
MFIESIITSPFHFTFTLKTTGMYRKVAYSIEIGYFPFKL